MTAEPTTVKCDGCGKFIPYADMEAGRATFFFEPDSHFGPERSEWTCAKCTEKDRKQ